MSVLAVHSPSSPEPTAGRVHFRKLSHRCANAYASEHLKAFCCFCNLLLQLNQYLNSTSHGFACFAIMAIANVRAKRETWLFCKSSPTSVCCQYVIVLLCTDHRAMERESERLILLKCAGISDYCVCNTQGSSFRGDTRVGSVASSLLITPKNVYRSQPFPLLVFLEGFIFALF